MLTAEADLLPIITELQAFTERFGGNYDGWKTGIRMDDEDGDKLPSN